ncbi:SDR family oxidoreductase [Rubrivirga sp. IMCC43871]|uniref:SDR family oxidoreductase n=1 Tax=Rubrivirga sp. IMCC43871 TaxID=3391575 RepID=UPI00398F8EB3
MTESRVALVTAASRGMGAACARRLAADGYRLALMSRTDEVRALADELGAIGITGDVSNADDLAAFVDAALAAYGRIDAAVCNTGHPPKADLLAITDDDWHAGVDLALLNTVRLARLVTPVMERQGGGAIVNVSTFGAIEPSLGFPVSSAIRAALGAFVKLYAERYGASGIRMNSVLPGFVETYPVDDATRARIPAGRLGSVAEVAATVAFLLSDGGAYVTGQSIRVDGGLTRSI